MASLEDGFLPLALAAHATAALTMVFVPPNDTATRLAAVIAIAGFCFRAIAKADRSLDEGQNYAEYMFGFMLHANCFLVLLQLQAPKTGKPLWQRFRWATVALFSPHIMLSKDRQWRETAPRWETFIVQRILRILVTGAVYDFLRDEPLLQPRPQPWEYAADKDSTVVQLYHGTFTRRDLLVRAEMTFLALATPTFFIEKHHALFTTGAVLFFGSDPADCPPLFGSIFDAWSVGRWYSHFWEKLMRKAFTINAIFIVTRVFRMRRTRTATAVLIMLCFAMSGLMHTMSGWRPGPCASWMPTWTYLATGVVVVLEWHIQALYRDRIHGGRHLGWSWKWWEVWGWRLFGYCWVVFWWLEIIPWAWMPGRRCDAATNSMGGVDGSLSTQTRKIGDIE